MKIMKELINELRFTSCNGNERFLFGSWLGNVSTVMQIFIKPFLSILKTLQSNKISTKTRGKNVFNR